MVAGNLVSQRWTGSVGWVFFFEDVLAQWQGRSLPGNKSGAVLCVDVAIAQVLAGISNAPNKSKVPATRAWDHECRWRVASPEYLLEHTTGNYTCTAAPPSVRGKSAKRLCNRWLTFIGCAETDHHTSGTKQRGEGGLHLSLERTYP